MTDNVLHPIATVTIRGQSVTVRELRWRDYLRLVKEMTTTAFDVFAGGGKIKTTELVLDKEKLIGAITKQEELCAWLFETATSAPKELIPDLTALEALILLEKIVELNLRTELITLGKDLAGRMGELFQVKTPSSKQSIDSSVPAGTASATSTK